MPASSYLAFDLGASSSRAVLGTLESDRMKMQEIHRFTTPLIEAEGSLFWDAETLWGELQAGLQKAGHAASASGARLESVSVDSWAVDYVPLDEQGRLLRNPYCYRDRRTENVMEAAFDILPASVIYEHTGIQFLPFNTLFQLLADQRTGRLDHVHTYLTIADYFNYRLSGKAVVERTMASTTQLMDVHTGDWSSFLMGTYGIEAAHWPAIVAPGTRLGPVLGAPSIECIASCSHDTGSAVAAVPAGSGAGDVAHWAYISCGTWSLMGVERMTPLLTEAACRHGFTHEAGLDGTLRFLKNLTGLWVLQECVREWNEHDRVSWERLIDEAGEAPSQGRWIDLEDPRFLPRGGMEQRLQAYYDAQGWPRPSSRAQLARTILESIADSYRRCLVDLESLTGATIASLYIVGGGSQNALLCELTHQATGLPVTAGPVEATALGNLLVQARTRGRLPEGLSIREVAARSSDLRVYR